MSIDIIEGDDPLQAKVREFDKNKVTEALTTQQRAGAKDLIVVFGGWGGISGGGKLPANAPATGTSQLVGKLNAIKPAAGRKLQVIAYEGSLTENPAISNQVLYTIFSNFHPLGMLIIYGYSAGGFQAMRLSSRFNLSARVYDITTGQVSNMAPPKSSRKPGQLYGLIRVDLLVTVDAATGPTSGLKRRRIFPAVRHNLNLYQTHSSPVGSHGGANQAVSPSATLVQNTDLSTNYTKNPSQAHGKIDNDTIPQAVQAIKNLLKG